MTTCLSRRRFLRALSLTGAAGFAALHPLSSAAHATVPRTSVLTETRLLMGTMVSVTVSDSSRARMEDALHTVFLRMEELVPLFDRHASSSAVSVLNAQGQMRDIPQELSALLSHSRAMAALTEGAFNPTVQPLVDIFRRHASTGDIASIPETELAEARALVSANGRSGWISGRDGVRLEREGMGLTLDGIAKGWIADIASRELAGAGLPNHLINAGGDIVASGEKAPETPWQVAVANPVSPHTGNARHGNAFALRNAALATSGSYEIYYDAEQRHHHLISASTGSSPIGTISASALAPSATDADALATAFSVMPPRDALRLADKLPGCGCLLLSRDGSVLKSRGWPS